VPEQHVEATKVPRIVWYLRVASITSPCVRKLWVVSWFCSKCRQYSKRNISWWEYLV